jgi:hypothetical protein
VRRVLPAVAAAVLVLAGASGSGVALASPAPGKVVGRGNNGHGPLNVPAAALLASPAAPGEFVRPRATYKGRFANGNAISFTLDKSGDWWGITSVSFDGRFKGSAPGTVGGTCWTQFQNPITFDPPLSIMGGAGHDDHFSGGVAPWDRHSWTFSGSSTGAQSARGTLKGGERDYGDPYSCVIDDQSWTATTTSLPARTPGAAKPVFGVPKWTPPVAGKKLVFTLAVDRSDTGSSLTTGKMTCDPSVVLGEKYFESSGNVRKLVLKHSESFTGGEARVTFVVPKTAKGKLLEVKVKITNGAQSATKVVVFKAE